MDTFPTPTPELVQANLDKFESQGSISEAALRQLLTAFPENGRIEDVFLKAVAINSIYSTNIFAIQDAARHIHELKIDDALGAADLSLVHDIAQMTIAGKPKNNYSFATKYCAWHRLDIYPIYDSLIDEQLWRYRQQDSFATFRRDELRDYPRFVEIVHAFSEFYGLSACSVREIDKFLWVQAKKL